MNVEPTALIIEDMSHRLRDYARDLNWIATKMRDKADLGYAAEAVNAITNLVANLRLDLLVTRPIREYETRLQELEDQK